MGRALNLLESGLDVSRDLELGGRCRQILHWFVVQVGLLLKLDDGSDIISIDSKLIIFEVSSKELIIHCERFIRLLAPDQRTIQ